MTDIEREPLLHNAKVLQQDERNTNTKSDSVLLPEISAKGRKIGWASAYVIVMSRVIGSGIFAMPGTVLQNVGSPALAVTLWVVGALIAGTGLCIDLEYGCMLPRSGGIKIYLEYTYQRPYLLASTMVAVHYVLLGFTASNCIIFAKYICFALEKMPTDFNTKVLAITLLTSVTIVHGCFYRTGLWIQNILGWLKIGLILVMILSGFLVLGFKVDSDQVAWRSSSDPWEGSEWSYNIIATTLLKIFYSYAGLDNMNNVLTEVKNPIRTLKIVAPTALITACLMYVLINVAYMAVIPLEEIKQSRELVAGLFFQRVFGDGIGRKLLPIAIALSAAGNVMVVTFSIARVKQEIARQGFLPFSSILGSIKPFGTPLGGLLIHYIPSFLVIAISSSATVYGFIANVEGYAGQFFAIALAIGLLILRQREPYHERPFRAWKSAVYFRILLSLALALAPFFSTNKGLQNQTYAYVAFCSIAISILYWLIWTRALPYYGSYRLEEKTDILDDGTAITTFVRKHT